jgi:hypothetical protein
MRTWFNDKWACDMTHIPEDECDSGCPCLYTEKTKEEKNAVKKY